MTLRVAVEVEDRIDTFEPADNGAGPLWCHGSTVVARHGEDLFVAGLETLPGQVPLNNTRWVLYHRRDDGDGCVLHRDGTGRTREPSPVALLGDELWVSANPTLTGPGERTGPAEPALFRFDTTDLAAGPVKQLPAWHGAPAFSEHSYRTVSADGDAGQILYMQNEGYEIAHLSFRHDGTWHPRGLIRWPFGDLYDPPQPLRLCYPNVMLHRGIAHFLGVGDIVEPVAAWRAAKKQITGRDWDFVFRRLFYARSRALADAAEDGEPFGAWLELANRDATAGTTRNCDLWVDDDGRVHLLWIETTTDARLRDRFFAGVELRHTLEYAVLVDGAVDNRRTLASQGEEERGLRPQMARFHAVTPDRAVILAQFVGDEGVTYRAALLPGDGDAGLGPHWVDLPFARPMEGTFLTNTVRGGSAPSPVLDLVGIIDGPALGYARVRWELDT